MGANRIISILKLISGDFFLLQKQKKINQHKSSIMYKIIQVQQRDPQIVPNIFKLKTNNNNVEYQVPIRLGPRPHLLPPIGWMVLVCGSPLD